ncbi:hypothetical protein NM208_g7825 [Fusarium decemcellulare]|uniref:Uncharacterized protein n=1 Tax=Fusarium decemcellulare TaxID=57161 RepID=A0ACC1S7T2_9HYPO|nr:hypothetical protein NM208_g7825 [Fusarium decemcellulare]
MRSTTNSITLLAFLAFVPLLLANPTVPNSYDDTPIVKIRNGTLSGIHSIAYNQDFFLGIPFAAPPMGNLRFARPAPSLAWNGTRVVDKYGDWCMANSLGLVGFSQNNTAPMSEDCLNLNVIRPSGISEKRLLPVLVWIHGGAWQEGSGNDPRYNGTFLVKKSVDMGTPIVFISFNYRLGLFGLISGQVLEKAGQTNILLHDQRQALLWIQENIRAFGGNPSRVTIMGESSGAGSMGFHLLAYGGRDDGLFHAAIAESGGPFSVYPFADASRRESDFSTVLNLTSCTDATDALACLRSAPAHVIQRASLSVQPYFTVDGDLIPCRNSRLLQNAQFVKVPLLIGVNRNEGSLFIHTAISGPLNTDNDFVAFVKGSIGDYAVPNFALHEWLSAYENETVNGSPAGLGTVLANPGTGYGSGYGRATLWIGDYLLGAGRRYANQVWARHGVPSYSYFFDTVTTYMDPKTLGVAHAQEIPFVFGNTGGFGWDQDPYPNDLTARKKCLDIVEVMSRM